jgi:hypothetical protein
MIRVYGISQCNLILDCVKLKATTSGRHFGVNGVHYAPSFQSTTALSTRKEHQGMVGEIFLL